MKTAICKAKGRRLQKLVAEKIGDCIGLKHGKDQPVESRPMGQGGCDIRLDETARKLFPFTVECKNTERWAVVDAIDQCKKNLYPNTDWLVVFSKNNFKPVAVLDLDVLIHLIGMANDR